VILAALLLITSCVTPAQRRQGPEVRYVLISPQVPDELLQRGLLDDVIAKLGRGGIARKLGWMVRILLFQEIDEAALGNKLQTAFELAERYDLPLGIHIDSEVWWESRGDLWNWWDPNEPGYDSANAYNVEWSDWHEPTTERWINWGTPTRLAPRPCFRSPRVRREVTDRAAFVGGRIERWRQRLIVRGKPELLVAVNPTMETGIDDTRGIGARFGVPDERVGFCSLWHRGYRASSPPASIGDELAQEVQDYAHFEVMAFRAHGIPRELLFTHAPTGNYARKHANAPAWTAVNPDSLPGFSTYGPHSLSEIVAVTAGGPFAIAEAPWRVLPSYIDAPGLRWIALYNWCHTCRAGELFSIANDPEAHATIRDVLGRPAVPPGVAPQSAFRPEPDGHG
jgi:hypothetical protein